MAWLLRLRALGLRLAAHLAWLPPLVARITVGWIFLESGWGKVHNLPRVVEFFRGLGIPAPEFQAPLAAWTELVCGALLIAGLLTRLAAPPLIIVMIVAIKTAKADDIASLSDLFGLSEFLYIVLLLWLAIAGAGAVSLDALIGRFMVRSAGRPAFSEPGASRRSGSRGNRPRCAGRRRESCRPLGLDPGPRSRDPQAVARGSAIPARDASM